MPYVEIEVKINRNDHILIGPDIRVCAIPTSGGYAVIGIQAPRSIAIVRDDAKVKEKPCPGVVKPWKERRGK